MVQACQGGTTLDRRPVPESASRVPVSGDIVVPQRRSVPVLQSACAQERMVDTLCPLVLGALLDGALPEAAKPSSPGLRASPSGSPML